MLTEILARADWKHEAIDSKEVAIKVSDSKVDMAEAINHIVVSRKLKETAGCHESITEELLLLNLLSQVMNDLLHDEKEGLPGAYRKVKVCVSGRMAEHPDLIGHSMENYFDDTLVRHEGERIFDFLARLHTEFQCIHPFRDGNGRIVVNMILLKHGYPILVFPTTLGPLFNHAVGLGVYGLEHHIDNGEKLFSRLVSQRPRFQVSKSMKNLFVCSSCPALTTFGVA